MMDDVSQRELQLPPDALRTAADAVFERILDRYASISHEPAVRVPEADFPPPALQGDPPEEGRDIACVLDELDRDVWRWGVNLAHPRFFAFIPAPGNAVGVLGDALASAYNPFVGTWLGGAGPSALEARVVDWLRKACGYPPSAGGLLTSGGSLANLTALAAARLNLSPDSVDACVAYVGDQTHYSSHRALRVIGIAERNVRVIPSDDGERIDVEQLRRRVVEDRNAGGLPLCVVASAGTTGTGVVDPINELADVCGHYGMWLHVDGAYGASAALSPKLRPRLGAIERADSISVDPHKWLFQPIAIGCLLVREPQRLQRAFRETPDYLREVHATRQVNFADLGLELTRGFRALKLWMTVQYFGMRRVRAAIEHGAALAEFAEEVLASTPGVTVVTPASLGIVTFRFTFDGGNAREDQLNAELVRKLTRDGRAMVSSTAINGRTVLRLCTINPSSVGSDVEQAVELLAELAGQMRS